MDELFNSSQVSLNLEGPSNKLSHNRCYWFQPLLTALVTSVTFKSFWILLWEKFGSDVTKTEFRMIENITQKGHIVCYTYET